MGFDEIRLAGRFLPSVHYWRGITEALRANGIEVITASVPASASIEQRAAKLSTEIEMKAGGKSVNIIAHSMGGLDARYMISRLKPLNVNVLSLTTIASPHRGSAFADYMLDRIGQERLSHVYGMLRKLRIETGAFSQLTRRYMQEDFNPKTPDREGVRYFSYGATVTPSIWSAFRRSHRIIEEAEGPNDGLVSVRSSRWGGDNGYKGTLVGVSHLDLINWTNRLRWLIWQLAGNKRNFNAVAFYLDIGAVGSVEVLTVRINTGYCAPPGGSRSTVGFLSAGNGTISGLLPTIATGSVSDSSFGPFGTTTGPGSGPSASPFPLTCPIRNNTIYINDFGTEYNAFCGRDLIGDAAIPSHTDTFEKCLDFCDIFGGRAGVSYSPLNSSSQANYLPYDSFTGYAKGPGLLLSGLSIKGPAINEFANRVLCPALDKQTITDPFNESYLIGCGKTLSGNADIAPAILKSLAACLLYCSLDDDCLAVTFTGYPPPATGAGVSYNCFPRSSAVSGLRKRQDEVISSEPGSQFAIRVSRDQGGGVIITSGSVPGGVASTQATEQVPSGTGGSFAVSGNSTQTGGSFSPTRTAGNSTQTGGSGSASSTGTTVPSVTGGFGNATGTSTGVAPPTASNTLSCSGSSNTQYTDEFNTSYNVTCGLDITGSPAVASHADTFNKCISFCDILSGCAGVTYQTPSASTDSNCHPYSSFTGYSSIPGPSSLLAAIPAKGGLVNNTFSYDQLCPGRAGQSVTDRYGVRYTIGCGEVISGTDLPSTVAALLSLLLAIHLG
ncbi:hypothetical protein MMC31_001549 [Peltigera leucophlebia]|nr:hypothetical protein [Peltigera leucophlebia]